MSGTIVVDRIESDASYASSINIASPIQISNTITGNVNFDSGTLFVDATNDRVGIGTSSPTVRGDIVGPSGATRGMVLRAASDNGAYLQLTDTGSHEWYVGTPNGTNALVFGDSRNTLNDGTERMRIDSSGRVTMPYQPMFQAYLDNVKNFSTFSVDQAIPFDVTTINQGSNYNTSTYRFTAPIAGKYIFSCYLRVDLINTTAGDYVHPYWSKNGGQSVDGITARMILGSTMTSNDYQFISSTIMVNLAANDYIEILHGDGNAVGGNGGSAYYQGKQCWMNGFLIG